MNLTGCPKPLRVHFTQPFIIDVCHVYEGKVLLSFFDNFTDNFLGLCYVWFI